MLLFTRNWEAPRVFYGQVRWEIVPFPRQKPECLLWLRPTLQRKAEGWEMLAHTQTVSARLRWESVLVTGLHSRGQLAIFLNVGLITAPFCRMETEQGRGSPRKGLALLLKRASIQRRWTQHCRSRFQNDFFSANEIVSKWYKSSCHVWMKMSPVIISHPTSPSNNLEDN